jgi:adenylyl cyclase-associated protein
MKEASRFYANRVIKENKDKNPEHIEWINSFMAVLDELSVYVKKHHTTGLSWNPKGADATAYSGHSSSASISSTASPAPASAPQESAPKPVGGSILADLSKGTAGLKKVDKSEMTHKNPALRAGNVVKAVEKTPGK